MNLARAIEIAREAHAGQVDKGGRPYIEDCLRVMDAMETEEEKIVAVLHDVIEDAGPQHLAGIVKENLEVATRVYRLTRRKFSSYRDYIAQIALDDVVRRVKIADLKDDMDLSRIPNPTAKDIARIEKYRINLVFLEQNA